MKSLCKYIFKRIGLELLCYLGFVLAYHGCKTKAEHAKASADYKAQRHNMIISCKEGN